MLKKYFSSSMILFLLITLGLPDLAAERGDRGGRGGGSRGRDSSHSSRGHSSQRSINRSPSMSRSRTSSNLKQRSQRTYSTGTRLPSSVQRDRQAIDRQPRRTETRRDVQNFIKDRPTHRAVQSPSERVDRGDLQSPDRRPSERVTKDDFQRTDRRPSERVTKDDFQSPDRRPSERVTKDDFQGTDRRPSERVTKDDFQRPDRGPSERVTKDDLQRLSRRPGRGNIDRNQVRDQVRDRVGRHRPNRNEWFHDHFWDRHNYHPPYYNRHDNWWKWATVSSIGGWLGWYGAPVYYDYYYGDEGYIWGTSVGSYEAPLYHETKEAIESAEPAETGGEWMPLGVFALTKDGESSATPNVYLQLAIDKEGNLSGTLYNSITEGTYEVEGVVDQESQLAAWKGVDDEDSPIMETGVFNLTQDEVPVRIHFETGEVDDMLLIRLEEPKP